MSAVNIKDGRNTGKYLPSAWDNKHLFTFSGTYSLPKNWDIGAKLRVVGARRYTPYDVEKSSYVEAWDASAVSITTTAVSIANA